MQADLNKILEKIRIVMVRTTHPGNIGGAARAMKTMGLSRMGLVRPKIFPAAEATARAAGADDILQGATLYNSVLDSVADCGLVLGTSNRDRSLSWQVSDAEAAARTVIEAVLGGSGVAILFGPENSGLSNRDLEYCHGVIRIPVNEDFASLNIAAAVQVICYELHKAALEVSGLDSIPPEQSPPVSAAQMALLYEHMKQCLLDLGFYDPERPRQLMRRLIRLFNRLQLDENEYNIIRGILAAAQEAAKKNKND